MILILLPILEMHFCTYVIIGAKGNIETQVATALAPFAMAMSATLAP